MRKALVIAGLLLLTPSFSVAEDDMSRGSECLRRSIFRDLGQ